MDSSGTLDITERLNADSNGYLDLHVYGPGADLRLGADLLDSTGATADGLGSGWIRLTAAAGSILDLGGSRIIGANAHLVLAARDGIGTVAAPVLTRVALLTAATSEAGAGDVCLTEDDNLSIVSAAPERSSRATATPSERQPRPRRGFRASWMAAPWAALRAGTETCT